MNFQHKYLKYKSKYFEIKYGHIQIFKYKVNNDNDLEYKQKYLKYKSKYLDIKYGGVGPSILGKLAAVVTKALAATPVPAPAAATPAAATPAHAHAATAAAKPTPTPAHAHAHAPAATAATAATASPARAPQDKKTKVKKPLKDKSINTELKNLIALLLSTEPIKIGEEIMTAIKPCGIQKLEISQGINREIENFNDKKPPVPVRDSNMKTIIETFLKDAVEPHRFINKESKEILELCLEKGINDVLSHYDNDYYYNHYLQPAPVSPVSLSSKIGNFIGNFIPKSSDKSSDKFYADAMKAHLLANENNLSDDKGTREGYKTDNGEIFKTSILKDIENESKKQKIKNIAEVIKNVLTKQNKLQYQGYLVAQVTSYNKKNNKNII